VQRTPLRRRSPLRRRTPLRSHRSAYAAPAREAGPLAQSRPPRWVVLPCGTCGASVKRPWRRRHKPAFCCITCAAAYHSSSRHPQHRPGHLPPLPHDWKERAERVRKRDGYRCRDCGKTQRENGSKLHVDHVPPRRWFSDPAVADHEDNLLSRCASCHGRKTTGAERKLLRGDMLAFRRYAATVEFLPCAKERVKPNR
jgi:HNH endonuclease